MKDKKNYLYTENAQALQMPYADYETLVKQASEGVRLRELRKKVIADLSAVGGGKAPLLKEQAPAKAVKPVVSAQPKPVAKPPEPKPEPIQESVPVAAKPTPAAPKEKPTPAPAVKRAAPASASVGNVPPIKKDIAAHFNKVDASGRLFNVFKQYYTCLNDACGGTVRVTIKDGICSIWNYDEWEEFAYVDIFDSRLRIGVNPHYTEQLKSLDLCEVPRLLARRHNLICVQADDLNQIILDVLITAFNEVSAIAQ